MQITGELNNKEILVLYNLFSLEIYDLSLYDQTLWTKHYTLYICLFKNFHSFTNQDNSPTIHQGNLRYSFYLIYFLTFILKWKIFKIKSYQSKVLEPITDYVLSILSLVSNAVQR